MSHVLGEIYPNKEKKTLEFKEYCFKILPSLLFNEEEMINYINGKWDENIEEFNNQNIKMYFDYYIPKIYHVLQIVN